MSQYTLPFLEVVLLLGMVYIFWRTRKIAKETKPAEAGATPQADSIPEQKLASQMAQDVAQLVAELQTVAGATRDDIIRQRVELQDVLNQAKIVTGELQAQLQQASAITAPPNADDPDSDESVTGMTGSNAVVLDIVCSPHRFGEYLQTSGCTQDVITVATDYAQEFILWYTGQFEDDEPISQQIGEQHVEDFLAYLHTLKHNPGVIKRRSIALKAYTNWMNSAQSDPDTSRDEISANPPQENSTVEPDIQKPANYQVATSPVGLNGSHKNGTEAFPAQVSVNGNGAHKEKTTEVGIGPERQQAVFELAEAGLDQLTIASKTGIEQDAVRLMLMLGHPAYAAS